MGPKHKVNVTVRPPTARPSSAHRRAAKIAALSTEQADLKREAAERRLRRDRDEAAAASSTPLTAPPATRSSGR